MLARALSGTVFGLDGVRVEVEADIADGLPGFHIVGLGDRALQEARERVKIAINNSGRILGNVFLSASGNGNTLNVGNTANPMAKARPATHLSFFIFPSLRYAQKPDVHSFRRAAKQGVSFNQHRLSQTYLAPAGGSSYAVKPSSSCKIPNLRMLNLYRD